MKSMMKNTSMNASRVLLSGRPLLIQQQKTQHARMFSTSQTQQIAFFNNLISKYNNNNNNKNIIQQQQQQQDYSTETSTTTAATTTTKTIAKQGLTEQQVEDFYMKNHIPLSHASLRQNVAPYTSTVELDTNVHRHREPKDMVDKMAYGLMSFLRIFVHAFFRDRYIHHAVVLETVAAVPGIIAGCLRHFTSLRTMSRDHGWIGSLVEEAENERMHLLTWMQVTKPTLLERMLVVAAQIAYTTFYTFAYIVSPRFSHRVVGYLEEEAVAAYTQFLEAIDKGDIPNTPAPEIAKKYWNLAPDATLRDVVLVVRADECMHRDYNHNLATKARAGVH